MKARETLAVFNRGLVSRHALARVDVSRVALSAEEQENWMPRVLGAMSLRPGTMWHGNTRGNQRAVYVPFVFSGTDTALLEITSGQMRIWEDGDTLLARPSVSASITNPNFTSDLSGWTDADEAGAVSQWATGGYMSLTGTKYAEARRRQSVSISQPNVLHALRVVVARGPLLVRIGTTAGADNVFSQAVLRTGTHSLAFVPGAGTIHIEFANPRRAPMLVDSVRFEAGGVVEIPVPWAAGDLGALRGQQVGDLIFCACEGHQQRRIERRSNGSWSVVLYESDTGPFVGPNTDGTFLTPSALEGAITLTASRSRFTPQSVGKLYRLTSQGQRVEATITAESSWSGEIRVSGVGASRNIEIVRGGAWMADISLQRSIGEPGSWTTVQTYTNTGTTVYNDNLDNTVAFYRIGVDVGDFTSGTIDLTMTAATGSITGVVRVTGYSSATSVSGVVLKALGGTDPTEIWEAGSWGQDSGYPTAVALYEGRLWWAGRGRIWGSVSDEFDNFNPDHEGDAAPIDRAIGDGSVDRINWLLPVQRLIIGSGSAEHSVRSTSFDEPVTPSNFNLKEASTQGSMGPVIRYDSRGVYIQRSGSRVYEIEYDIQRSDYASLDMTALVPELGAAGFRRVAVQRQPDTRIYAVRADGKVAVLVRDPAEDVMAWVLVSTKGVIEDVAVLPGEVEDRVFWIVRREINGATVRFHEELQRADLCTGGAISRLADAGVLYDGAATDTLSGFGHLEGEEVVVWADGRDLGTFTVSGGLVTLPEEVSQAWVGLGYRARYKSSKLAVDLPLGLSLSQRQRVDHIGLILADTHARGLRFGPSFDVMDSLPLIEDAAPVDADHVWEAYAEDMVSFPGEWSTDARICLEAEAPRPCTVLAAVLNVDTQPKGSAR